MRDGVNGAADQRSVGNRKKKGRQPAGDSHGRRDLCATPATRRRQTAVCSRCCGRITQSGSGAEREALECATHVNVQSHERFETPAADPFDDPAH
jgi:hypothetical protein